MIEMSVLQRKGTVAFWGVGEGLGFELDRRQYDNICTWRQHSSTIWPRNILKDFFFGGESIDYHDFHPKMYNISCEFFRITKSAAFGGLVIGF